MGLSEELSELASDAQKMHDEIRQGGIKEKMAALKKVSDEAKRAWSGSNIGYHARTYFFDLHPAPAGVQFNPEWGLLHRYGTHQPDPSWLVMDFQSVIDELLRRADWHDPDAIKSELATFRERAADMKERCISLLTAGLQNGADAVISRQLKHVEPLDACR